MMLLLKKTQMNFKIIPFQDHSIISFHAREKRSFNVRTTFMQNHNKVRRLAELKNNLLPPGESLATVTLCLKKFYKTD